MNIKFANIVSRLKKWLWMHFESLEKKFNVSKYLNILAAYSGKQSYLIVGFFILLLVSTPAVLLSDGYKYGLYGALYDSLRLFAMNGEWVRELTFLHLWNWPVLALAFINPFFTLMVIISFALKQISRSFSEINVPEKDHIVLCGIGEWGSYFIQERHDGLRFVVIEQDENNPNIGGAIEKGCRVIIGDASSEIVLKKANAINASKIIVMANNDSHTIEIAMKIRLYLSEQESDSKPVVMPHIDNIRLAHSLAQHNKFNRDSAQAQMRAFNVYQQSALALLEEHPSELYADIFQQENVHIVIYGLGEMGINLIYVIAHICHYKTWTNKSSLDNVEEAKQTKITILDKNADQKKKELYNLFPNLDQCCEIDFVQLEITDHILASTQTPEFMKDVSMHIVCFRDETAGFMLATSLRRIQMNGEKLNAPIFVRMPYGNGVSRLIESNCDRSEVPDNIYPFGQLKSIFSEKHLLNGGYERIAYLIQQISDKESIHKTSDSNYFKEKWSDISDVMRQSNYFSARYLPIRLRALGYELSENKTENRCEFKDNEIEVLARLEHDRYLGERWITGWCHGERSIADSIRLHPELEKVGVKYDKWAKDYWDAPVSKFLPELIGHSYSDQQCPKECEKYKQESGSYQKKSIRKTFTIGLLYSGSYNEIEKNSQDLIERVCGKIEEKLKDKTCYQMRVICNGYSLLSFEVIEKLKAKHPMLRVLCLLPLPYDVHKPMVGDMPEMVKSQLGKEGLRYIEMPLLKALSEFPKGDQKTLDDLKNIHTKKMNAYIKNRSDVYVLLAGDSKEESNDNGYTPRYFSEAVMEEIKL